MKSKRIIFLAVVLSTLLLINCATAIDESKTVVDEIDDVIDINGDVVSEDPNIDVGNVDIKKIEYDRSGSDVTIVLEVVGEIENRGSILDLDFADEDFSIDTAGYTLVLITDQREYTITYVNFTCNLAYFDDEGTDISINITDFNVDGAVLTINFELVSSDEVYDTVSALTQFMKFELSSLTDESDLEDITLLFDEATDQPLSVVIFEFNDGTVDNPINFSALGSGGTPPYSYRWDFGDGSAMVTERNPTHIFQEAGKYDVNVTVTDSEGSTSSDEVPVNIIAGGDNNNNDEPNPTIFFGIIAIIAVIGVVVVIYIIRR